MTVGVRVHRHHQTDSAPLTWALAALDRPDNVANVAVRRSTNFVFENFMRKRNRGLNTQGDFAGFRELTLCPDSLTRHMTRHLRHSFLGLMLFAALVLQVQFAHAGHACDAAIGHGASAVGTVNVNRCIETGDGPAACAVVMPRTGAARTDPRALSPAPSPLVGHQPYAARRVPGAGEPHALGTPHPLPPAPVHILLRRFLS